MSKLSRATRATGAEPAQDPVRVPGRSRDAGPVAGQHRLALMHSRQVVRVRLQEFDNETYAAVFDRGVSGAEASACRALESGGVA